TSTVVIRPPHLADRFHSTLARRSTWTPCQYRYEQELGKRVGRREHLSGPVVLHLQRFASVAGERHVDAILTWRKTVGPREAVVADHGCGLQIWRHRKGDRIRSRLAYHEPTVGRRSFHSDVARGVSRKLVAEGFHV